ncbi:trans-sulfuration enzyme family protein [Candidatus Deianiraea vastatrix]|uniref:O-acetylhomoserine thiolase MetZ n=1 Tax=Candidatus Deianiraea vastatrix TaxID=2163644 RepID=A0A5B8XF13_9RICK|nr:PLP-dependent aspartate aminotransferase family protein [Candidatus Deianiraea vastatrix]QED23495.1 Putative O-acetylhomoserine thiolase MetZ [Candidatus Deianiraea vastatrix]
MSNKNSCFETNAIRVGSEPDPINGSVIPGIFQTSTYVQESPNVTKGFDYTRCTNPTRKNLETCLASLEETNYCLATASGLSAITCILNLLPNGANIVCGNDVYGGTYRLLATIFNDKFNVTWVDTTDSQNVENVCKELGKIDLLWIEAVSNPLLRVTDIEKVAKIAKNYGGIVVVDSTFLTPYLQKPVKFGADIIVHSLTKYINGHSDVLAGGIFTNSKELFDKLYYIQKTLGPSLSPFDSWLVLRGVKTLAVRMKAHQENAIEVAKFLTSCDKVEKVFYPGLETHKNSDILKSQCEKTFTGGGMISFYIKGNLDTAKAFIANLKIFQLAESLGGIESLVCVPALMTHASVPKNIRDANGVTDNLIRLSVGIEGKDDIMSDLQSAFSKI